MARALKIEFPNAFYHVMSRGQNRQTLFFSSEDFNIFINLIRTEVKKFNIKIFAFCLMTNHYHLYLSTPDANLSKFIKSLNQRYAQYYLKKYPERDGHVFRGRYKRVLVENELYSKNLIAYVHNNPYQIVEKIEDWKYSTYPSYLGKEKIYDFVDYEWTLRQFCNSLNTFITFHNYMKDIKWNFDEHIKANNFICRDNFINKIVNQYLDFDVINYEDITGIGELRNNCNIENLINEINSKELPNKTKFDLEIYFLKEFIGKSLKELAEKYNKKTKSISKSNIRFKKKIKNDPQIQKIVRELIEGESLATTPRTKKP